MEAEGGGGSATPLLGGGLWSPGGGYPQFWQMPSTAALGPGGRRSEALGPELEGPEEGCPAAEAVGRREQGDGSASAPGHSACTASTARGFPLLFSRAYRPGVESLGTMPSSRACGTPRSPPRLAPSPSPASSSFCPAVFGSVGRPALHPLSVRHHRRCQAGAGGGAGPGQARWPRPPGIQLRSRLAAVAIETEQQRDAGRGARGGVGGVIQGWGPGAKDQRPSACPGAGLPGQGP